MANNADLCTSDFEHTLGLGLNINSTYCPAKLSAAPLGKQTESAVSSTSGTSAQFDMMDRASSSTLKRNPKMELSKSDMLKLLSYLEGELQARDIVIAALKSEKVKQVLQQARYRPLGINDPYAALFRDSVAVCGVRQPPGSEVESRAVADQQMESLENLVLQQRQTQLRMATILKDAEDKHKKVIHELEEEKRKHEHDTAQGDDITYGLEMERTRLKQDLELEKQSRKKSEKELKKLTDMLEEERARQKQIVLFLLAVRKKKIMKYIEEQKRSADLAQILAEEKVRIESMAEGLEEESKKSLSMEAELEKQQHLFDNERKTLRSQLTKTEKRVKDQECELAQLRTENESLWKALDSGVVHSRGIPPRLTQPGLVPGAPVLPAKPIRTSATGVTSLDTQGVCPDDPSGMGSSVAKVVQPTATVSSVPVCGPTTGIARSISPGQGLRQGTSLAAATSSDSHLATKKLNEKGWSDTRNLKNSTIAQYRSWTRLCQVGQGSRAGFIDNGKTPLRSCAQQVSVRNLSAPPAGSVAGAKHSAQGSVPQPPPKKGAQVGRGVPPPIPPNKPVMPPKRDQTRRFETQEDSKRISTGGAKDKPSVSEVAVEDLADYQQMLVTMVNKT